MNPPISHNIFEVETEFSAGSSLNINMLEGSIWVSLRPEVTCLFFQLSSKIKLAVKESWFLLYSSISIGFSLTTGSF